MSRPEVVMDARARSARVSAAGLADLDTACFAPGDTWSDSAWQQELDAADRVVLVVTPTASAPIAAATFQVVADTADLHRVMVRPEARGRRLAQRLLEEGFARCAQRGAERMLLEVEHDNAAALALYRRLGFSQIARRDDYYGPGRPALVLQRSLGAGPGRDSEALADDGGSTSSKGPQFHGLQRGDGATANEVSRPLVAAEGGRS